MDPKTDLSDVLHEIISPVEQREEHNGLTARDLQELELLRGIQGAVERGEFIEWTPPISNPISD